MKTQNKISEISQALLLSALLIKISSLSVAAQSSRQALDDSIIQKVNYWKDSVSTGKRRKNPLYIGGGIALAFPQYTLKSRIEALNGLKVSYIGTAIGGVVANQVVKLKANVGLYYSNPSVPYNFEMLQGSLSSNIYFLRIKKITYHTFEPYAKLGLSTQRTKFYGNYLPAENRNKPADPNNNYSSFDQPLLSVSLYNQLNTGLGVEYQLENCKKMFIHLFAEMNYGVMISSRSSNVAFNRTITHNPLSFSVGVNVGIIK